MSTQTPFQERDDAEVNWGIAEIAAASGLSQDTLRGYERESLVPAVRRGADGQRRYTRRMPR